MKVTVSEPQLELIDKVRASGKFGKSREEVLAASIMEHARYVARGGTPFDMIAPSAVTVDEPESGELREEIVLEPITGKAVPVHAGEVLRISQVEGGTCVDYNAYNLHDYKEYLDCGFNRMRGLATGKGSIAWTGSPRGRPMHVITDHSDRFYQYYQGHRCNGITNEIEYGFVDHPNCQDTFAETIREYGLTPDDVHDSYNLWMQVAVTPDGQRQYHWNKAEKGDYVDLLALMDTLSVPVICGGVISPLNNFDPKAIRLQVFAASTSTGALVKQIQERFGHYQSQRIPDQFRKNDILARRDLIVDPAYVPSFLPAPKKTALDVTLSAEMERQLERFLTTGNYLRRKEDALLQTFLRWYEATWPRDRAASRLVFRKKSQF
jgi:uncharacterized protein YcgI (DUF1989 family)